MCLTGLGIWLDLPTNSFWASHILTFFLLRIVYSLLLLRLSHFPVLGSPTLVIINSHVSVLRKVPGRVDLIIGIWFEGWSRCRSGFTTTTVQGLVVRKWDDDLPSIWGRSISWSWIMAVSCTGLEREWASVVYYSCTGWYCFTLINGLGFWLSTWWRQYNRGSINTEASVVGGLNLTLADWWDIEATEDRLIPD